MADLVIVAANVVEGANAEKLQSIIANEAITAGQAVRKRSADGKLELADADGANIDDVLGIAQNSVSADQPCDVQTGGLITLGVGTQGVPYFLSPNAGGIAPILDILTGDKVQFIGVGTGTGISLGVFNSNIAVP